MKKLLDLIALLLIFAIPSAVNATSQIKVETSGSKVNVDVNQQSSYQNSTVIQSGQSSDISIHQNGGGDNSVRIDNNNFEIKGTVTAVKDSSFDLSGQKINLDSSKISQLKSSGILTVGNTVTAKGTTKSGQLNADSVIANSINLDPSVSPTPSPSISPSKSPTATVSSEILGTQSENKPNLESKNIFFQFIDFCKGLLSSLKIRF